MAYVVKIKYEDTLRRLTYESKPRGEELLFAKLESKIRDLFKLPVQVPIRITYNDTDGDVITLADDQDLVDALVLQSLNPLRLYVTVAKPKINLPPAAELSLQASNVGRAQLPTTLNDLSRARSLLRALASGSEKQNAYPSRGSAGLSQIPPYRIAELLDVIAQNLLIDLPSVASKNTELRFEPDCTSTDQASSEPEGTGPATLTPRANALPMSARSSETCALPFGRGEAVEAVNGTDDNGRAVHSSVKCDGCGMSPIAGPRYKSMRKHDYDLCQGCFKEYGTDVDYARIDRPLPRPRQQYPLSRGRMRSPVSSANVQSARSMSAGSSYFSGRQASLTHQVSDGFNERRLDARFVQDVTVMDGTEVLPGTCFTKVWRLYNSGTISWPSQTKLVHVAGHELGNLVDVPLELQEHGVLPNEEVDASVELTAPEKPGRYVSHWRLAAPAGTKFGHRVWVLIQVVSKLSSPPGDKQSNPGMYRADDKSYNASHISLPVVAGTREAFVKASHRRLLAQRVNGVRNSSSRSWARYMDVEEPFSGMRIKDIDSLTDRKGRSPISAKMAEIKDEQVAENPAVKTNFPSETPCIGLTEILPTAEERDVHPVSAPATTVEQLSRTPVDELPVTSSNGGANGDHLNAFVEVVYPDSDSNGQTEAEEVHAERVGQEQAVAVDSSELEGGFSMVEMPVEKDSMSPMSQSVIVPVSEAEFSRSTADQRGAPNGHEERETPESGSPKQLSAKLEAMGFADHELNMELLVNNKLDLRRTLSDLVKASEWDPILEELKEMGFTDRQVNLRLMFENKGSVKRVVKDLVQKNKEPILASS